MVKVYDGGWRKEDRLVRAHRAAKEATELLSKDYLTAEMEAKVSDLLEAARSELGRGR